MQPTDQISKTLEGLRSPHLEVQEKTANGLYRDGRPGDLMEQTEVAAALRESVSTGNLSPAAFLLLGHDRSKKSLEVLKAVEKANPDQLTKLNPWDKPVWIRDVLLVPLLKTGDASAPHRLLEMIEEANTATLTFLLQILVEIDSPEILHSLARTLDDKTVIGGGAPHGVDHPRRLADAATDAFMARLNLKPGFEPHPARRYEDGELAAVKQAIINTIPR